MGGLAVVVNWDRSVAPHELDPMLGLTPHRATGGTRRAAFEHAAMAETFFTQDAPDHPAVTTVGHLSIVGDLRLWDRDGLKARAGGGSVTAGLDDRRLLLAAYQRTGIGFLDDVDGDFAFVIWDNQERSVLAVRDRFGVKPLFFERTPSGIRFASEVKQLITTSVRPVEPSARSVAEYMTGRFEETRFTFFDGIERVRPSTALIADPTTQQDIRYWDPNPDTVPPPPRSDVAEGFREHLTDAVRRRLATTDAAVSHLTGGLDSSSITAAAHLLTDRSDLPTEFHTVSAVFPGHSNDESAWIDEIAASQPFPHHNFVPNIETIEGFEVDTWRGDTPRVPHIGGLWDGPSAVAKTVGADLLLTGVAGDEVLDQYDVLADLLRHRHFIRWQHDARRYASWSGRGLRWVAMDSARGATPPNVKRSVRSILRRSGVPADSPLRGDVYEQVLTSPAELNPTDVGFPSLTQNLVIAYTRAPLLVLLVEYDETRAANHGLASSHPYLDRQLIEFVASIPVPDRPFDGRSKTLARSGFAGYLPQSVLDRRTKTVADGYFATVFNRQRSEFRARYPEVSPAGADWLDAAVYAAALEKVDRGDADSDTRRSLWTAWTLMIWIDGLGRYRHE